MMCQDLQKRSFVNNLQSQTLDETVLCYHEELLYNEIVPHYNFHKTINNLIMGTSYLGLKR